MGLRCFCTLLGIAVLATANAADAKVHRVKPGQSIQAAIDAASPGDTILVWPGTYRETSNERYGLKITTDNLRLIGKVKRVKRGRWVIRRGKFHWKGRIVERKVRILHTGDQETGIYAAPVAPEGESCEYDDHEDECSARLTGVYIRGFKVEGFPKNGIQTRWVDGFKFVRNESANNLNNGIYPTLSTKGLVLHNRSYGSLDTAMWVAGSEDVRVVGNEVFGSPIGFEITVSNNVYASHNYIHDNTVGVGLFHPNAAGNPERPGANANWVITRNKIVNNNLPNPAPPDTFQAGVPPGVGVLLLGVSDHVIEKNLVKGNDFVGIGVLGWCTATALGDPSRNCVNTPPIAEPAANNNRVANNLLIENGTGPSPVPPIPGADIMYFQTGPVEIPSGNCFEGNQPAGLSIFSTGPPPGVLPTDGC